MAKLMDEREMVRILLRLAHEILEKNKQTEDLILIGIQRRGAPLAERISKLIKEIKGKEVPTGSLDITFYRDDLTRIGYHPVVRDTNILIPIDDKKVILVDDVLYTGRTVRAALEALLDFGRPRKIELLILVDRGHRELPIFPNYVGKNIPTSLEEMVEVKVKEIDSRDEVIIIKKGKNGL